MACDLDAGQWGVAVQSKFLAVGSVVPWAEPHVGAVATQSYANPRYGPDGLALLRQGVAAKEVVRRLTEADEERETRQLGVVDAEGRAATFTGPEVAEFLHAATIAVVGEVPLERLFHAIPAFPTRSEVWLYLLEELGVSGPCYPMGIQQPA